MGGVHAPVRVVQMYLMLASKLTTRLPLAANLHYVTLLREPTRRFISEFYETYDGWEVRFGTPPQLSSYEACSARLPHELRRRAIGGIDNASKAAYDELFPHWIRCPTNMAANRQTRALSFNHLSQPNSTGGLRSVLCRALPGGAKSTRCDLQVARRALYQFSFIGLGEERCATERLLEAQYGLKFQPSTRGKVRSRAAHEEGKDAHKVPKLRYEDLARSDQQRVRWNNRDDLLLYAEAERLFHERLAAYGLATGEAKCRRDQS